MLLYHLFVYIFIFLLPILLFVLHKYVQYKKLCKLVAHIPGYEQFLPPQIKLPNWIYPTIFPKNDRQFLSHFVVENTKKFGNIWKFCLFDRPFVVISGPQFTKFNSTKHSQYLLKKAKFTDSIREFTGDSVFTVEDDNVWRRHRQILNPAFTDSSLKNTVFEATNNTMDQFFSQLNLQTHQRNIVTDFNNITLNVIGLAGFGLSLSNFGESKPGLVKSTNTLLSSIRLLNFLPNFLKKPWFWPLQKVFTARADFQQQIQQIITKRQEEEELDSSQKDILSILLANSRTKLNTEDSSWKPLSTEELIANCFIFIVAGFETTSRTLSFALYLLCKYPTIQNKARKIVESVLVDEQHVEYSMLDQLEYIHWIVLETLRLFPVAPGFVRIVKKEFDMYDTTIPKGSYLFFSSGFTHRNAEYWPLEMTQNMPMDEFIPERWEHYSRYHSEISLIFTPFGSGPRKCIGEKFAMYESIIVLARLLHSYQFSFGANSPLKQRNVNVECVITLRPSEPIEIVFSK